MATWKLEAEPTDIPSRIQKYILRVAQNARNSNAAVMIRLKGNAALEDCVFDEHGSP